MKRILSFWSIAVSFVASCVLILPSLRAASLAGSNLVVTIRAEGSAEVRSPAGWQSDDTLESLAIPVTVRVRLNRATNSTLSLSLLDSSGASESLSATNTDGAPIPLSTSAVPVRWYSHSGTYSESIVVTRPQARSAGSVQLHLLWTLASSDGAISWTTATAAQLPMK